MSCERFAGALTEHAAGGELPSAVRVHLDGCAACREALATARREMADLDRDLEAMLSAEPSVEFAARVRQRIDREREAGPRGFSWRWAFGVAAAAVVAVAVVMAIRGRGTAGVSGEVSPPPSQAARQPAPPATNPVAPASETAPAVVRSASARTAGPAAIAPPRRPAVAAAPEVLVPADQRLALARVLAMSRAGMLDGSLPVEPAAEGINVESPPVVPLVVDNLKVTPITIDPGSSPGGGGDPRPRPQAPERAGRLMAAD